MPDTVTLVVDGVTHVVPDDGASLLDVLRDRIGARSVKDGCAPQGQCGCCTVLVDGQPRVACVTAAKRVDGRSITTVAGLDDDVQSRWAAAMACTGASQCGFCTPGIVVRLSALAAQGRADGRRNVDQALLAHLCRCTGWQGIRDAVALVVDGRAVGVGDAERVASEQRALLEGGTAQRVGRAVILGDAGFADDDAPADALVALRAEDGRWVVGESVHEARLLAAKVQGRRSTIPLRWPIEVPDGDWARVLQTTWVEPAYLEPDAACCAPGGEPATPLGNGGAFGAKRATEVGAVARRLADEHGRAVRVLYSREDVVRLGPKRPPLAVGLREDGTGIVHVARTDGIAAAIASIAPGVTVVEVDVIGPPTSAALRSAGRAEVAIVLASLAPHGPDVVVSPGGARATAALTDDGAVLQITVSCGTPLDPVVLRSYCIGAAHQALGWVRSEAIAVDDGGEIHDLTIRSFGILRAQEMPEIDVVIEPSDGAPVNGSDAVFAAVAAAAWRAAGHPARWPCQRR